MESPESWNLLTSSLAVSQLDRIEATWAFLVLQGIVDPRDVTRQAFATIVGEVIEEGEITGPSEALRVATRLGSLGMTTGAAHKPDPWGKIAKSRRETVQSWHSSGRK